MRNRFITPPRLAFTITLAAIALHAFAVGHYVAISDIPAALWQPDPASFGQIYVYFSIVPRFLVALLAGGALAFTGVIFQQLLKTLWQNPRRSGYFLALSWRSPFFPFLQLQLRQASAR